LRLLLVEDSDSDAGLFMALIKASSFIPDPVVTHVRSVMQAKGALMQEQPDCVLLDLGLPDAVGLSGLDALRTLDSGAAILMLTGLDDDATALSALRSGAQDYIVKDNADPKSLSRAILRSIQRHQVIAELAVQKRDADFSATHDALTGLANRRMFDEHIARLCAGSAEATWWLVLLDLDGFKAINDTYGHGAGDAVLKEVAQRLRLAVRKQDLVARLGGDEFALLLTSAPDAAAVAELILRLRQTIEEPIAVGADKHRISASIGQVVCPTQGREPTRLLAEADRLMYADKKARRTT
jgi:diguanylate cyclase (GGDEF)-like protein